jgi:hypothetical protein
MDIVEEIEEEQNIEGLGTLVDFDPSDTTEWPKCAGVHVLYDVSQRLIYVGKAKPIVENVNSRLSCKLRRIRPSGDSSWRGLQSDASMLG